ncbi:DUF2138 family protein [Massilia horti]|uniref:DUF2138 family protein n=1 Tax=Massilia horti TaxID=2562153 RepID=A0A4Y9T5F0_9BURK|nr:DUF2138 family protein [Massilia horti]TFW32380.1 DUF2138 family protein [Massilia horti]
MKKTTLAKFLAAGAICTTALFAWRTFGWGYMAPVNSLHLDLAKPDALVLTESLSTLPRDLLSIPLARDVLREDFLFYYEQNEDRLGLKGSLRRIAYEHELTWGDQLIRMVLDEPAEVALWRDGDGTLKHFAIAVSRGKLARLLEEAGKVALKDSQLRLAGDVKVGSDKVAVYAFEYAYQRTLLVAAHGERMVILSHPGMLFGGPEGKRADAKAEQVIGSLLMADAKHQQVFHDQFRLGPGIPAGHSVAVKADFLSFGYQPFFGALEALRFDFSRGRWQSQVLIDGAKLHKGGYDSSALWAALPYNPSGCFSVPADWASIEPVLQRLGAKGGAALQPLATQFNGPAAACWYGTSRLHTPVFIARRRQAAPAAATANAGTDASLAGLFGALVGGQAEHSMDKGVQRWTRTLGTPAGELTPTLAASGDLIVFSADPALVDQVLAVQRKQAPAASDRLPDAGRTVGLIDPAALSQLVEKEAFDALPASSEPVLREAADAHLIPRLAALRKYPAYRMVVKSLPSSGLAWTPLEWQAAQ